MTTPRDIYPFSTADGKYIPIDVIDGLGFINKDFTASATDSVALPAGSYTIALRANAACYVRFGEDIEDIATVPADGVYEENLVYVPADMQIHVYPYNKFFSVIGETDPGTLRMQFIQQWHGLTTQTAVNRS